MGDRSDIYRATQQRFVELAADLDDDVRIPATPAWNVRELLAHVTGVAADVASGNVLEYAQEGWTQAQVESRAGLDRTAILAEWESVTPTLTAVLDDPAAFGLDPMYAGAPLADLIIHRQDLREAGGLDPAIAEDELGETWPRRLDILDAQLAMESLPAIRLRDLDGNVWEQGEGEPAATVTADLHELWLSMQGRRTKADVLAYEWEGDPEPYLGIWPGLVFAWRDA